MPNTPPQDNRPEFVRKLEALQRATKELIAQAEVILRDAADVAAAASAEKRAAETPIPPAKLPEK